MYVLIVRDVDDGTITVSLHPTYMQAAAVAQAMETACGGHLDTSLSVMEAGAEGAVNTYTIRPVTMVDLAGARQEIWECISVALEMGHDIDPLQDTLAAWDQDRLDRLQFPSHT